jgi:hypothetical protein
MDLKYLKDPYTRLKIISNVFTSIFYIASSAIIWLQFKKSISIETLITIDNIWSPLLVAGIIIICNKFRENIIKNIIPITILYFISITLVDFILFLKNEYIVSVYILQTISDISILNIYCYSFNGFEARVFDKAESLNHFNQWKDPIGTIAIFFGGVLGVLFAEMPLRFLVILQMSYDFIWFLLQLKLVLIGKHKIYSNNLL